MQLAHSCGSSERDLVSFPKYIGLCVYIWPFKFFRNEQWRHIFLPPWSLWSYIISPTWALLNTIMKIKTTPLPQSFIPCSIFPFFHSTYHFPSYHNILFIMFTIYYLPYSASYMKEVIFTCLGHWCIQGRYWKISALKNVFFFKWLNGKITLINGLECLCTKKSLYLI